MINVDANCGPCNSSATVQAVAPRPETPCRRHLRECALERRPCPGPAPSLVWGLQRVCPSQEPENEITTTISKYYVQPLSLFGFTEATAPPQKNASPLVGVAYGMAIAGRALVTDPAQLPPWRNRKPV